MADTNFCLTNNSLHFYSPIQTVQNLSLPVSVSAWSCKQPSYAQAQEGKLCFPTEMRQTYNLHHVLSCSLNLDVNPY